MRFSGWAARTAKGGDFMNHNPVVPAHNKASATTYFFNCDIRRSSAAISSGMIWSPQLIVVAGNFTIPTGVIYRDFTQYKKAPTFAIGCECLDRQPNEKERLNESRKVYRDGRSSGHYFRCRDGCSWQVDHGMPAGDQGIHHRRVHARTAGNSVRDLRGRDLGCLVARPFATPRRPAGGL